MKYPLLSFTSVVSCFVELTLVHTKSVTTKKKQPFNKNDLKNEYRLQMLRTNSTDVRYKESRALAVSMDTLAPDVLHILRSYMPIEKKEKEFIALLKDRITQTIKELRITIIQIQSSPKINGKLNSFNSWE